MRWGPSTCSFPKLKGSSLLAEGEATAKASVAGVGPPLSRYLGGTQKRKGKPRYRAVGEEGSQEILKDSTCNLKQDQKPGEWVAPLPSPAPRDIQAQLENLQVSLKTWGPNNSRREGHGSVAPGERHSWLEGWLGGWWELHTLAGGQGGKRAAHQEGQGDGEAAPVLS